MTRFAMISYVNDSGQRDHASEDLVGWSENSIWALDGASSSKMNAHLETLDLIQAVDTGIREEVKGNVDPQSRMRAGLRSAARLQFMHQPSASGLVATVDGNRLRYAALGDVTLVVENEAHLYVVNDPGAVDREKRYLGDPTGIDGVLAEVRKGMNQPHGYWIIGNEPMAADHARLGTIDVDKSCLVLIATDGFARLVDLFGAVTWESMFAGFRISDDIPGWISRLRLLEAEEGSMRAYPRAKVHDDAAAALFRLYGASSYE